MTAPLLIAFWAAAKKRQIAQRGYGRSAKKVSADRPRACESGRGLTRSVRQIAHEGTGRSPTNGAVRT